MVVKRLTGPGTRTSRVAASDTARSRALVPRSGRQALATINLPEVRRAARSVYVSDHPDLRGSTRVRWLISTCLAAGVAAVAFGLLLYGSMEPAAQQQPGQTTGLAGIVDGLRRGITIDIETPRVFTPSTLAPATGGKTDRLLVAAKGQTTRNIIHDQVKQRIDDRDFIDIKPYVRVVGRLSSAAADSEVEIPPFNPLTLFVPASAGADRDAAEKVKVSVLDLEGGALPVEDGQDLSDADVLTIVQELRANAEDDGHAHGAGEPAAGSDPMAGSAPAGEDVAEPGMPAAAAAPGTAVVAKNRLERAEGGDDGQQVRTIEVGAPVKFTDLLRENGVSAEQAQAIAEAARPGLGGDRVVPGQQLRLVVAPGAGLSMEGQGEPAADIVAASVFLESGSHIVSVTRGGSGSFAASRQPPLAMTNSKSSASLYTSFYRSALAQNLPPPMITTMLKTFAYDTDFKRRVGPGDGFELFFDLDDKASENSGAQTAAALPPRDLLFMSLTVGGETHKFYRFRLPEGGIDYFDPSGSNARKFLLRKPVRGDVRFTSGFGMRLHPLLKIRKMHTGIDWAGTSGTPIIASGSGVIEEYGRKGGNGNYARINHANGYQTAYSHMSRFQSGLGIGSKVAQGQVIGYLGSTGLSSGPHLHFEVLVNRNFSDPMTIHVPRERQLETKALADFQREVQRIDDLMNRAPVSTVVAQANAG
jgi:murein DD-endopeptidase MepM/ murein hydrolase activator NlpD